MQTRLSPPPADTRSAVQVAQAALAVAAIVAFAGPAHAQDVLGISTVREAVVTVFKAIAFLGIIWGFFRHMSGRHTVEGLVTMGVGALGVAKADAIAGLLGIA